LKKKENLNVVNFKRFSKINKKKNNFLKIEENAKKVNIFNNWYKLFSDLIFLNLFYNKNLFLLNFLKKKYLKNLYKSNKKNKSFFFNFNLLYSKKNLKIKLNFIKFKITLKKINRTRFKFLIKNKTQNYIKKIYKFINFRNITTNFNKYSKKNKKKLNKFGILSIYTGFHNIFYTFITMKGQLLLKLTAGSSGITKKNVRFTRRSMRVYFSKISYFLTHTINYKRIKSFKIIFCGPRKFFYKKLLIKKLSKKSVINKITITNKVLEKVNNQSKEQFEKIKHYSKKPLLLKSLDESLLLKKLIKVKKKKIIYLKKNKTSFQLKHRRPVKIILIGYEKLIKKAFNGCRLKRKKR
jgi:hypothetical protein